MRLNPLIGALLLLLIVCACASSEGEKPGTVMHIVFNALLPQQDSINYEIFIMDMERLQPSNISKHPAVDWACHGWKDKIYFISDRDTVGGVYFLYQYHVNDKNLRKIVRDQMADSWMDSRKDGTELIICTQDGDYRSFKIIDTTGYEIREVIRTNQYLINDPAFSPDGKWIVYRSTRSGHDELWIADELGSHQRQLTRFPADVSEPGPNYYHAGPPRWLPNSNIISYTSRRGNQYHIFSINADGTQNIQITSGNGDHGWHCWTPDRRYLIYDGNNGKTANSDLFLLDTKDQKLQKLTDTPFQERAPLIISF